MDVVSHAGWGYAALRWRGQKTAWWGALAGAAPDLLTFVPPMVERVSEHGWEGLSHRGPRNPGVWRTGGPPLPQDLVDVYNTYYVYTHSLVVLALVLAAVCLFRRRQFLWFGIPYALHILMDIPTHERFQTPFLYPLSLWTFEGVSWGHPLIFWPNWVALIGVHVYLVLRYARRPAAAEAHAAEGPGSQGDGSA